MKKIKVLIVDDHAIILTGLKALLARSEDIEVIATSCNGKDAIAKVDELIPNVVLLDIEIPLISGIEVTEYITKNFPDMKVILYTSFLDEELIIKGIEAGASGYITKTDKSEHLLDAIRTVLKGEKYFRGEVSELFSSMYFKKKEASIPDRTLTNKEIEILKCVADGLTNQEIANLLSINIRTVEMHKYHIRKKLLLNSTADLVKYAIKHNITEV